MSQFAISDVWLSTDDAADLLDCSSSNLAQFSRRLDHVVVHCGTRHGGRGRTRLAWPRPVIEAAARVRKREGWGPARAIEHVTGEGLWASR